MGEKEGVEEIFKRFIAEVGSPGIFSKKATREKYLREAISWGYKGRESEMAELSAKQQVELEELKAKHQAEISGLEKALAEQLGRAVEKPAITPREYGLEQEVRYQASRAEEALGALMRAIADYEAEKAALRNEIANQEIRNAELQARVASLESTIADLQRKGIERPAVTPREYSLEQEARYEASRAEEALGALMRAIADYEAEKAALREEIAKREREARDYMEKTKELKEKIKKIIEIVE